jgi:hypothetical protein
MQSVPGVNRWEVTGPIEGVVTVQLSPFSDEISFRRNEQGWIVVCGRSRRPTSATKLSPKIIEAARELAIRAFVGHR